MFDWVLNTPLNTIFFFSDVSKIKVNDFLNLFSTINFSYQYPSKVYLEPWKYNTRRNVNSDFSIVTMRRVAIIFFKLEVVKKFMQKF